LIATKPVERILSVHDRCDSCDSQAYVKVTGVTGDLTFCSHHYSKIMNSESSKAAMENFSYETVDERGFVGE
jgi:hypothetical protein